MTCLLLDTNILVYGIDQESRYFDAARHILNQSDMKLVTTSKNLVEFLTVVTKSSGYGLDQDVALDILDEIIRGIEILYPSQVSFAILLELVGRYQPQSLQIHDFEIVSIGLANEIHDFATFNRKDFKAIKEISLSDFLMQGG